MSEFLELDCEAAAASHAKLDGVASGYFSVADLVVVRIGDCIGFFAVGIDCGFVFHAGFEEVEGEVDVARLFGVYASGIPVFAVLVFTSYDDEFAGFGIDVFADAPVEGNVFDELESVHALGVVLGGVGGHL